jgi:hypothetical protein
MDRELIKQHVKTVVGIIASDNIQNILKGFMDPDNLWQGEILMVCFLAATPQQNCAHSQAAREHYVTTAITLFEKCLAQNHPVTPEERAEFNDIVGIITKEDNLFNMILQMPDTIREGANFIVENIGFMIPKKK